jgi:hypothetical protein
MFFFGFGLRMATHGFVHRVDAQAMCLERVLKPALFCTQYYLLSGKVKQQLLFPSVSTYGIYGYPPLVHVTNGQEFRLHKTDGAKLMVCRCLNLLLNLVEFFLVQEEKAKLLMLFFMKAYAKYVHFFGLKALTYS